MPMRTFPFTADLCWLSHQGVSQEPASAEGAYGACELFDLLKHALVALHESDRGVVDFKVA